jgi:hypothetical protein
MNSPLLLSSDLSTGEKQIANDVESESTKLETISEVLANLAPVSRVVTVTRYTLRDEQ